jgi:hypothetical protein
MQRMNRSATPRCRPILPPHSRRAQQRLPPSQRSGRLADYAVILDVVTARTPSIRAAHISKAVAELEASGH